MKHRGVCALIVLSAWALAGCGATSGSSSAPSTAALSTSVPRASAATAPPPTRAIPTAIPASGSPSASGSAAPSASAAAESSSAPVEVDVPEGYKLVASDDGFALALPADWQELVLSAAEREANLDAFKQQNPEVGALIEQRLGGDTADLFKLFAFDAQSFSQDATFVADLNVIRQSVPQNVDLAQYTEASRQQIEQLPNRQGDVAIDSVTVAAGRASKITYQAQLNAANGQPLVVAIVQYVVVRGGDAYAVTLRSPADRVAEYTPVFEQIGQSFQVAR